MPYRNQQSQNISRLGNNFLLAMPALENSIFEQSLVYICEHNEHGAMGIIINKPIGVKLKTLFEQLFDYSDGCYENQEILIGGPVQKDRGFVLHNSDAEWESTLQITDTIKLSTSRDILQAMLQDSGPENCLIALGYAGWEQGQLEDEVSNNFWLTLPADNQIIFNTPCKKKSAAAAANIGIDINALSSQAGHA